MNEIPITDPVLDFIDKHGFDTALETISIYAEALSKNEEVCSWHRSNYAHLHLELEQLLERINNFSAATMPEAEVEEVQSEPAKS
jgi:hypothetical protein